MTVEEAKAVLKAAGYVVVREKSYRQAQTRQAIHQREVQWANDQMESNRRWVQARVDEERRIVARCSYLYGLASALGATEAQLREDTPDKQGDPT